MAYKDKIKKVSGKNKGEIFIFALSTCGWCGKTKVLLKEIGVEYSYVDVDLLQGEDREAALEEMEKRNPDPSFPTIVIGEKTLKGFDEKEIRKALE
jgi:glutaredoxin-like protein NrdH